MTETPDNAVVYVYVCSGDAQPEEHEVRDLLEPAQRWRKIVFLRYTNGSDPEAYALARLHSIGPTFLSFVTTGVDRASRTHFDRVLQPSRAHWISMAREQLEGSKALRYQLRTARIPRIVVAAQAKMLSIYAGRLIRLSERGQTGLEELIHALNEELQQLILAALKK